MPLHSQKESVRPSALDSLNDTVFRTPGNYLQIVTSDGGGLVMAGVYRQPQKSIVGGRFMGNECSQLRVCGDNHSVCGQHRPTCRVIDGER